MGFKSDALTVLEELFLGRAQFREVVDKPSHGKAGPKPDAAVVIDMTSYMQSFSSPGLAGKAETFGELIAHFQSKIRFYFDDNRVKCVVVLLDCGNQHNPNKSISRHAKKATPRTPPEGWRANLAAQTQQFDDTHIDPLADASVISDLELRLPGLNAGEGEHKYTDYLTNKDFKKMAYVIISKHILDGLAIPMERTVMFRGPDTALMLRNGTVGPLPSLWCRPYSEGDAQVAECFRIFANLGIDVLCDSIDGDVITAALLTSNTRISTQPDALQMPIHPDRLFKNRVHILRGQWAQFNNTSVDVHQLYIDWSLVCESMRSYGFAPENPIHDLTLLFTLSGENDYVDSDLLPNIGAKTLFVTYLKHCLAFPKGLTLPHLYNGTYTGCRINVDAFARFVLCCYQVSMPHVKIDIDDVERSLHNIRECLPEKHRLIAPGVDTIRLLVAHISWTLSYFAAAGYGEMPPHPFEQKNGISLWGYQLERAAADEFGFNKAVWSTSVNIEQLTAGTRQFNSPPVLRPPQLNTSQLLSDRMNL